MAKQKYTYEDYLNAFEQAKITAEELVHSVDEKIFKTRPQEDKWCMGEILSHLVEIGNDYLEAIERGLDKSEEILPKGNGPFTHPFYFQWFINMMGPNQRPVPTVEQFEPKNLVDIDRESTLADFHTLQNNFISILEQQKERNTDLSRVKVKNPVIKWISMNVSVCFALTANHQRRHFEQMREIKELLG